MNKQKIKKRVTDIFNEYKKLEFLVLFFYW